MTTDRLLYRLWVGYLKSEQGAKRLALLTVFNDKADAACTSGELNQAEVEAIQREAENVTGVVLGKHVN